MNLIQTNSDIIVKGPIANLLKLINFGAQIYKQCSSIETSPSIYLQGLVTFAKLYVVPIIFATQTQTMFWAYSGL